jgi:hypothetical protein
VTCRLGLATSMISRTSRKSRQSWLVIRPLRQADLAPDTPRLVVSAIRTSAPLHCSSQRAQQKSVPERDPRRLCASSLKG